MAAVDELDALPQPRPLVQRRRLRLPQEGPPQLRLLQSSLNPQAFRSPSKLLPPLDLAVAVVAEAEEAAVVVVAAAVVAAACRSPLVEEAAVAVAVVSAAAQPVARRWPPERIL
jgi:hypothetical protein